MSARAAGGVILLGLLLAACATADPVSLANGQPAYVIRCVWGLNGLDQCFAKAGMLCAERGYTLRDWPGRQVAYRDVQQDFDNSFGTLDAKTILVQCNP